MRVLSLVAFLAFALTGCQSPPPARPQPHRVVITDFVAPWSEHPAPRTECTLEIRHDRLHFVFDVEDADVVFEPDWKGESTVDVEDRVELFFAADPMLSRYWCVEVDPLGRVHDYAARHYRQFDSTWNCPGLETRARRTREGYQVQGSLPLETLTQLFGRPIHSGTEIELGLFRAEFYGTDARTRGQSPDNWLSWVRPGVARPDFHVPSAFRRFRLP